MENERCLDSGMHEDRVGYQIKTLDCMFRKYVQAQMRQNGFEDISMMNGWIIEYLAHNENHAVYQKDLEQTFKVGRSSLSSTLKVMEEKGYIERKVVSGNGRVKQVKLTRKALAFREQIEKGRMEMEKLVCRGLTEEEIDMFIKITRKMQENLSE